MNKLLQQFLWLGVFLLLALVGTSFLLSAASTGRLNHVSGVWITMATDLAGGEFYRPLMNEHGYGGTRFFPLHFVLHALLVRLGVPLLWGGYAITLLSAVALVLGTDRLLRALGVRPFYALLYSVLTLASLSSHLAVTTIRGDLLPAALNVWGLAMCARALPEDRPRWVPLVAAVCFVLAFAAKVTTVFGVVAACSAFVLKRRMKQARAAALTALLGFAAVLFVLHFASGGRATESLLACASGGATGGDLAGGFRRMLATAWRRDLVSLITILMATIGLVGVRNRVETNLVSTALIATAAVTVLIFGSPGTDYNHLIDLYVIALVALAVQTAQSARVGRCVAVLLMMTGLVGTTFGVAKLPAALETIDSARRSIARRLRDTRRPDALILSQDPMVPVVLGRRPFLLDPFMLRVTRSRVTAINDDLSGRVKSGGFNAIILMVDPTSQAGREQLENRHFGKGFADLLLKHYVLDSRHGQYFVYRPRISDAS